MFKRLLFSLTLLFITGASLWADEDVFVRGKEKPTKGKVTAESPKGITIGIKEMVAAEDIVDIVYDIQPISAKLGFQAAAKLEKDSLDPANEAKRKQLVAEAIKKIDEVAAAVSEKDFKAAKRHLEYKKAMLLARQVQEDGEDAKKATAALKEFSKKHSAGWQIATAMETLGRLQLDQKDYEAAEDTYKKFAAVEGLPDEARQDAELSAIQVKIHSGDHKGAKTALQQLQQKTLPKRFMARARVAEAECLVAEKKLDEAVKLVREVIKDTPDKEVKAVAHNTLGYCYFMSGQMKEARWEFLWVDVVYNQDRAQHAKALYHLWKIFSDLGEAERAQECREALLSTQFAGMDFQRRAQQEAAKTQ